MLHTNTNSAFDFCTLAGVKSPSEFLELSSAEARKQFKTFTEQAKQLAALAQKATSDALQPLQAGATNAFSKVASCALTVVTLQKGGAGSMNWGLR